MPRKTYSMARLDDLIAQVSDKSLRQKLESALSDLKRRQRFGLVFEEHIPETTTLLSVPIQPGAIVQKRTDPGKTLYAVKAVAGAKATIEPEAGGNTETVPTKDLAVVKRFGDPIFPALTPLGAVRRGPDDRPHHAVINGENFHALQLFAYLFEGKADCIYIDPPFNTGARDWKYNNAYVDESDAWRHSKWLSMMEKRLRIAKRLLKDDGVLIIAIDEHEVNHLGMLLEKLFPEYLRYLITDVINSSGNTGTRNFGIIGEFLYYVVPHPERDIIDKEPIEEAPGKPEWEYEHLRRRGGASSYRHQRPRQFFPIFVDEEGKKVVKIGDALPLDRKPDHRRVGGFRPIWPVDNRGYERVWRFSVDTMRKELAAGNLFLGRYNVATDSWTLNVRRPKKTVTRIKNVWWESSHHAGTHGTDLLAKFLGQPNLFPFPKSVYSVRDALAAVVRNRTEALIIDFFAGSGTTLHATCLLNAADDGSRRTVLVTNNEVEEKIVRQLQKEGIFRGERGFEKHGIFEQVTRPRCEAVITGKRPDGKAVEGTHIDGRPFSQGFEENVEFFRLDYLDGDEVDLGIQFEAIYPSLWLAAGGVGIRLGVPDDCDMLFPTGSPFAILFREDRFRKFSKLLMDRPDITHVWIVTDSEDAFAEMRSALLPEMTVSMLYRDYLRNFRINTRQNT